MAFSDGYGSILRLQNKIRLGTTAETGLFTSSESASEPFETKKAYLGINALNAFHICNGILLGQPSTSRAAFDLVDERFKLIPVSRPPWLASPLSVSKCVRLLNSCLSPLASCTLGVTGLHCNRVIKGRHHVVQHINLASLALDEGMDIRKDRNKSQIWGMGKVAVDCSNDGRWKRQCRCCLTVNVGCGGLKFVTGR